MSTFGKYDDKGMRDVKSWIDRREEQIQKAEVAEAKYSTELDKALGENPVADKSRSVRRDLHQAQEWVREQKEHRERLSGKEKENTWEQ